MIALCLITCERYSYTKLALASFLVHNDPSDFLCLHADDASDDSRVIEMPGKVGFETLPQPETRLGCHANQRRVIQEAVQRGAEQVLLWQSDWEWNRPFPWDLYAYAFSLPNVYALRLFGQYKEDGRRPCGTDHYGKHKRPVEWVPLDGAPESAEVGDIHWTHTPAVTDAALARWLMAHSNRENEAMKLSGKLSELTVRPVENVLTHIGAERTPQFKP